MLIALEGIDGTGKSTQAQILLDTFKKRGVDAVLLKTPNYQGVWGRVVREYLMGDFGPCKDVHPKLAATLYLNDMAESLPMLQAHLSTREVVIMDRSIASTVAYQCGHLCRGIGATMTEAEDLATWILNTGFDTLGLLQPDLTIQLDASPDVTTALMVRMGKKLDGHEEDLRYMDNVRTWYRRMTMSSEGDIIASKRWRVVQLVDKDGNVRTIEEVAKIVWELSHYYCRDTVFRLVND